MPLLYSYCEESLLFKSPITNHTLEVPFINYVLLQCMYFVFQNNASSFASEEKSSTRGMMSRDRFQILKLFFLTVFPATLQRSLRRQLHSIVTSTKEQRRYPPLIFSATNQSPLKALLNRDWASFLEQVESALQIFSEMATPVVLAIRATISGNQTSNSDWISIFRDQASDLAGNAASMAGSALSAGWNAFNKMKDNYS